MVLELTK
jgi:DNA-binding CsgD family transcriptional regulator